MANTLDLNANDEPLTKRQVLHAADYIYTNLADLREGIFNVYGVVTSFTPPRKCVRGTDYLMTLTIIDPSSSHGLNVNLFGANESSLPKITYNGDIFRAHRLKVNTFNGHLQGVGGKSSGFSFLVFNRVDGRPTGVTKTCTLTTSDMERVKALKLWFESSFTVTPTTMPMGVTSKLMKINEIKPNVYFDVVAKVVRILPPEGEGSFRRIKISIWDGSGNRKVDTADLRMWVDQWDKLPDYSVNSPMGTLMNFLVWNDQYFDTLSNMSNGQWVLFKNIISKVYEGNLEGKLGNTSKMILLDKEDPRVKEREGEYVKKCQEWISEFMKSPENQIQIVSVTNFDQVEFSAIAEILNCPEPVNKFRTRARVVSFTPPNYASFTKPYCLICKKCTPVTSVIQALTCTICKKKEVKFVYFFQMRMEDETGNLNVFVYSDNGEQFLAGVPPVDLKENNVSLELLTKKMNRLLEPNVYLEFCVMSYYLHTKPQERKYQLFDTILKD